jgi:phosphoserine aminotransferase
MAQSNSETTQSSSPNGSDSSSRGLLSALLHWIKSYGGLSDLKKQNEKLAELETKLDTVLQSSDSNLTPTTSTETN